MLGSLALSATPASASSHREAPLISQDPTADNTDLYAFRDPADASKVDIIANYIGLEQPASGPNFPRWGDDVRYEINIDNNGDVKDDVHYYFRFRTIIENGNTFLYNTGRIDPGSYANYNERQTFSMQRVDSSGTHDVVSGVPVPPDNIGPRSTPDYEQYVQHGIASLPGGGKVFAGQRDDPFFVDLGSIFDLLGLRPLNPAHAIPLPAQPGRDGLAGKSVHSIVLQLPIADVSRNHDVPTVVDSKDSFIGIWAAASRRQTRVLSPAGHEPRESGPWVQVSRLGIPLVNEVLIPLKLKDHWNAVAPEDDAQFFPFILHPEPARLIPQLYPGVTTPQGGFTANGTPRRQDIVAVLSGLAAGLSPANALPPADLLRVNLAVPPNVPGNRLAVLAGDPGGFPNGRRLTDDVVDIELRLLAGGTPFTPAFNHSPNNALTDGVDSNDRPFLNQFPYEAVPVSGYDQPPTG
jgi:hypothetical protein